MQGKKCTLRLIYFKPLRFPSVPLFKLSNVLPLNLLYFKTLICFVMHNVFDNVKPANVCNLLTYSSAKIHHHNARFSAHDWQFLATLFEKDHLRNSFSSIGANIIME